MKALKEDVKNHSKIKKNRAKITKLMNDLNDVEGDEPHNQEARHYIEEDIKNSLDEIEETKKNTSKKGKHNKAKKGKKVKNKDPLKAGYFQEKDVFYGDYKKHGESLGSKPIKGTYDDKTKTVHLHTPNKYKGTKIKDRDTVLNSQKGKPEHTALNEEVKSKLDNSVETARKNKVSEDKILHNKKEVDNYFSGNKKSEDKLMGRKKKIDEHTALNEEVKAKIEQPEAPTKKKKNFKKGKTGVKDGYIADHSKTTMRKTLTKGTTGKTGAAAKGITEETIKKVGRKGLAKSLAIGGGAVGAMVGGAALISNSKKKKEKEATERKEMARKAQGGQQQSRPEAPSEPPKKKSYAQIEYEDSGLKNKHKYESAELRRKQAYEERRLREGY